jgi:hypothetical protein
MPTAFAVPPVRSGRRVARRPERPASFAVNDAQDFENLRFGLSRL